VVTSMLPEMAPHTYSINSDMLGTSTPENRYSNPWFLKHVEPEAEMSMLQQVVHWGYIEGCRRRCISRLVKLTMDVERYCTEWKAGEGTRTTPRRRHGLV